MTLRRIVTAVAAGCAALVILASPGLAAQATTEHQHTAAPAKAKMSPKCEAMMAEKHAMMTAMKAADDRIDGLVATMNAASDAQKAARTAAVVTEMVAQRKTMRDDMMKMHEGMMTHMMGHMQEGKDSMAMCPMMKMGQMK